MSITEQGLDTEPSAPKFRPQDNIFRSYNVLNPNIFENLIGSLRTVTRGDLSDHITVADDSPGFRGLYKRQSSNFESIEEFSSSIGLKGKYGVFSASANLSTKTKETSTFTTLYSTYVGEFHLETISLDKMPKDEMLALLRPRMVSDLNAISSMADARKFTNDWGTHLVTEVKTGGLIMVSNSLETGSSTRRDEVSADLEVKYTDVNSLKTTISMSSEIKKEWENLLQTITVRGGDVKFASAFNSDGSKVEEWADSVTGDTTYAIAGAIEIHTLADEKPGEILKKYIDLTMLAFSLEHPIIFSEGHGAPLNPRPAIASGRAGHHFKVIGGGATVTEKSNNFLIGCYPQSTNGREPGGWIATSHDLMAPTAAGDILTCYAITVHDPEDYLDITVAQGKGNNSGVGADHAEATLPDGWIMTCGGVFSDATAGGNKFVTASYFKNTQTWAVASSDYKQAATNVELNAYAIGIKSKDPLLIITADNEPGGVIRGPHGNPSAIGKRAVCGGGVNVTGNTGAGNLVQMNYPWRSNTWKAFNKDHDGSDSQARSEAFAVSLRASVEM